MNLYNIMMEKYGKKPKQILFNTEMIRAVMDGRKTQTRRPIDNTFADKKLIEISYDLGYPASHGYAWAGFDYCDDGDPIYCKGQYVPGDILYIRETFCKYEPRHIIDEVKYTYKADSTPSSEECRKDYIEAGYPYQWKRSIHMPKEAARIFLKVTDVRVERLQDITEENAIKESAKAYGPNNCSGTSARIAFAEIWDRDKIKNQYEWRTNPWVWVVEFEVIE